MPRLVHAHGAHSHAKTYIHTFTHTYTTSSYMWGWGRKRINTKPEKTNFPQDSNEGTEQYPAASNEPPQVRRLPATRIGFYFMAPDIRSLQWASYGCRWVMVGPHPFLEGLGRNPLPWSVRL